MPLQAGTTARATWKEGAVERETNWPTWAHLFLVNWNFGMVLVTRLPEGPAAPGQQEGVPMGPTQPMQQPGHNRRVLASLCPCIETEGTAWMMWFSLYQATYLCRWQLAIWLELAQREKRRKIGEYRTEPLPDKDDALSRGRSIN